MSRSRSSFDLSNAIATATSLSGVGADEQATAFYRGVPLVSFGPTAAGPPTNLPPPSTPEAAEPDVAPPPEERDEPIPVVRADVERVEAARDREAEGARAALEEARRPPKLPDLSDIKSPVLRCEKIIDWIVEAVGASGVFIADAAGLPIAGVTPEAEARLAAAGVVASAIAHLAAAVPGNTSPLFELHFGDGPFFQLIGFEVGTTMYLVGLHRATPLGFRQAHAVRLACRHALTLAPRTASSPALNDAAEPVLLGDVGPLAGLRPGGMA